MSPTFPAIVSTDDEQFEADVLEPSDQRLVIVDFWAEWCGPCRSLTPLLEAEAKAAEGRWTLVKANTEQCQQAAAQFGVSGIPAVFALYGREVIDQFQGLLPAEALQEWLARLLQHTDKVAAQRLVATDPAAAETGLRKLLEQTPQDAELLIALGQLLRAQSRLEECQQIVERLEARGFLEPDAEKLKAALDIETKGAIDLEAARKTAEAEPENPAAQFALAEALVGHQAYEEAFERCLQLIQTDRQGAGESARQLMVEVFQALPADSELTREYRRKLSMVLY